MQRTIFITGASSGLGKATAKLFQSEGWYVIATMRNPANETELAALENVTILPLDVTDPEQIQATVAQATAIRNIDVVFNNAGYGLMGALEALTEEQILRQINTNLLGVIRVTKAFVSHFREQGGGLFINTTSMGGLFGFPLHSIYHATKFAVEGWAEGMSFELAPHHIGIKTIAPGAFATEFLGRSLDRNSHPAYVELEDKLFTNIDTMMEAALTPAQVAAIVFEAATDGKDQVRYLAGADANALYARRLAIGSEAFRQEIRDQFFE
ncbi:SDR family oxidoreductase [Dyadobacter sp. Leaf189]|uniref:SDR family oxidoreductase n=1 Tax=Dyadobacter sp. Leaf189 TaxID=1736295 RepID=UPI0006F85489|nr:SDR family oxidoreductase [Dyadobacter sp. Leaf189]KQS26645.1 short-chain dehydrogenase [Dyadobacter sp. Leaf189]